MSKALRVLCVEDSEDDSLLLLRELRKGGYDPVWERADTAEAMSVALEEGSWDLVLSDFDMPGFSAPAALNLVQQAGLDLPFIVVSGVIGDEQAVAMMKAGAHDYVLKDNLKRLLSAIERSLHDAAVRRQRKQAEEALRQSEKKYKGLFDQSNDGILLHDEQGTIVDANNKLLEQFGYSRSEILNLGCPQLLSPGEVERSGKELQKAVIFGASTFETLFRRKNGTEFPAEVSASRFDQEDHVFAQCIVRDITERKRAQQELINSQRRLSAVLDAVGEGIITIDSTSTIVMVNQEVQSIWGYGQQELIGNQLHILMPEKYRPSHSAGVKRYLETGVAHVLGKRLELEGQKKDGSNFPLELRIKEMRVGERLFFTAAVRDITERKRAEELLRKSEADLRRSSENLRALTARLMTAQEEESKRISRELHDDFNQKIAALVIGIETIKKQLPTKSAKTLPEQLTELQRQAETLSDDVRRVAHILHPSILDHLGLVVALKSYCAEFTQKTGIETKFTHRNVRRALPKDVALCVYRVVQESLQNVRKHSDAKQARVSVTKTKDRVRLAVTDDGVGFDTELQSGERGIGLTSMEERVRMVSGSFSVQSLPPGRARASMSGFLCPSRLPPEFQACLNKR